MAHGTIDGIERRWLRRTVLVVATIGFTIFTAIIVPPLLLWDCFDRGRREAWAGCHEWFEAYRVALEVWRK